MSRAVARERVLAWLPASLYMALIWALSSMSIVDVPIDQFPLRDKGVHLVEYAVLAFLVAHASLRTWPDRTRLRIAAVAVLITFAWGVLDEVHQAFVPGRSSDALDLVADFAGAIVGTVSRLVVAAWRGRPEAPRAAEESVS